MKPNQNSSKPHRRYFRRVSGRVWPSRRNLTATLGVACVAVLSLANGTALASQSVSSLVTQALSHAGLPTGPASPYGEVSHFGGFSAGEVPGKFDLPAGFTVEPENPSTHSQNAVYVLDRTTFYEEEEQQSKLGYRLQKLSSTGAVLGSVALPVQLSQPGKSFEEELYAAAHPLISLAVDPVKGRVYALVESLVDEGTGNYVPVADELVAWSTTPNGSKGLEKASGYGEDAITHAALVANLLKAAPSEDLYAPEGIAVNPKTHEVVIEAQEGVKRPLTGGPTILQPVITEGPETGDLGTPWIANSTIAPHEEQGDGLFTASNGESFGVDLFVGAGQISRLADVTGNFASPEQSPIAEDTSGGLNRDQAPTLDNEYTVNSRSGRTNGRKGDGALEAYVAGSPIAQLTNGLYAARFGKLIGTNFQSDVEPWNGVPNFWTQDNFEANNIANMGVRLFSSEGTVVTTIGGQATGQECNLSTEKLAVAAGTNGSVFVLTQPNPKNGNSNDEVIEFAPGGKGACPQPSGTMTLNGESGSSFSYPVGTEVKFADTVERKGETPYRFDWVLLNAGTLATEDLKTQIEAPGYKWPAPSTSHTFTKAGTYYAAATVYGDYGLTYITTVKITIH